MNDDRSIDVPEGELSGEIYVDSVAERSVGPSHQRVLLVTDRVAERHILLSALDSLPVVTAYAPSRSDALRLAGSLRPDLVILDVELDGEGWTLCEELLEGGGRGGVWRPSFILLHGDHEGVEERARELGLGLLLRWPFAIEEARSLLEVVLAENDYGRGQEASAEPLQEPPHGASGAGAVDVGAGPAAARPHAATADGGGTGGLSGPLPDDGLLVPADGPRSLGPATPPSASLDDPMGPPRSDSGVSALLQPPVDGEGGRGSDPALAAVFGGAGDSWSSTSGRSSSAFDLLLPSPDDDEGGDGMAANPTPWDDDDRQDGAAPGWSEAAAGATADDEPGDGRGDGPESGPGDGTPMHDAATEEASPSGPGMPAERPDSGAGDAGPPPPEEAPDEFTAALDAPVGSDFVDVVAAGPAADDPAPDPRPRGIEITDDEEEIWLEADDAEGGSDALAAPAPGATGERGAGAGEEPISVVEAVLEEDGIELDGPALSAGDPAGPTGPETDDAVASAATPSRQGVGATGPPEGVAPAADSRDALAAVLSALFAVEGVTQVVIVRTGGEVVYTSSKTPLGSLGDLTTSVVRLFEGARDLLAASVEGGAAQEQPAALIVEGERGCTLLHAVGPDHRLLVCVSRRAGLGQVRFMLRRLQAPIIAALSGR